MTLREAGVQLIDCEHKTPPAADDGYPYIAIPQVRDGRLEMEGVRLISHEHFVQWTRKARPQEWDVILSRRCNPGETAVVPADLECALGQNLVLLRTDRTKVAPEFLRWLVRSSSWWEQVQTFLNVGAVFDSLKCADVPSFALPIPPLAEQRAIAHILGTLDDKIELNRRMSETLESIARALFQSWFVDFDPVRAEAEQLTREGVLEIGDGYRAKNSELGAPGLPFIRAGDLNAGFDTAGADVLSETSVARAGNKISRAGDVAFTSKGTIGRFARVTEKTPHFVYSPQVCFWRSLNPKKLDPVILYCWMQSDDLKRQITAVAGQTDMAPYVSLRDQRQMEVPVFPDTQHLIAGQIRPLFDRQAHISGETKTLASIRDRLLPDLISGELRVRDSERFTSANR
jgi:type I restriction enzyme S subunit